MGSGEINGDAPFIYALLHCSSRQRIHFTSPKTHISTGHKNMCNTKQNTLYSHGVLYKLVATPMTPSVSGTPFALHTSRPSWWSIIPRPPLTRSRGGFLGRGLNMRMWGCFKWKGLVSFGAGGISLLCCCTELQHMALILAANEGLSSFRPRGAP